MKDIHVELPVEVLQRAAAMRPLFPGLTDPEIVMALLIHGLDVDDAEGRK